MLMDNKVEKVMSRKFPRILLAGAMMVGVTAGSGQVLADTCDDGHGNLQEIPVKIYFNASNCPVGLAPGEDTVTVCKAKKRAITWTAYEEPAEPGGESPAKIDQVFTIYFDPFRKSELESDKKQPNNALTSPRLGDGADIPLAEYKYTIVGTGCNGPAWDPRIVVK